MISDKLVIVITKQRFYSSKNILINHFMSDQPYSNEVKLDSLLLQGQSSAQYQQVDAQFLDSLCSKQKEYKQTTPKTQLINKNPQQSSSPQSVPSRLKQSQPFALQYYKQFFNCLSPQESNKNYQDLDKQYGHILKKNNIWLTKVKNTAISVHYKSLHSKVITLIVQITHFAVQIEVYQDSEDWFDNFVKDHGQVLGNGSQGRVIKLNELGCVMKQYHIENFRQTIFSNTIVEYAITKIASSYEMGPKIICPFIFDIYCTKNHMYFFLEQCQKPIEGFRFLKNQSQVKALNEIIQQQLKKSLFLLHRMQIIHFDIKPQNIMFSPGYNKYVFIDFGMAECKLFFQGQMQPQKFRGTFYYASSEMRDLFLDKKIGYVDVYYNDCMCLNKSLEMIRQASRKIEMSFYQSNSQQLSSGAVQLQFLGISQYVQNLKQDESDKGFESDKLNRQGYEFQVFQSKDYEISNKGSFMSNSLVIYITYLLYHRMYDAVEKVFIKTQTVIITNIEAVLEAFFQIGMNCYQSDVFLKLVNNFLQSKLWSKNQVNQVNRPIKQLQPSLNKKKLPEESYAFQMLEKNPFMVNFYRAYCKKNEKNKHMITSISQSQFQSLKLSDFRNAQLNSKSIFYSEKQCIKQTHKNDKIYQTYYMIECYVRTMYEKLCLHDVDLNKQSRLISVFQTFHDLLQILSGLDKSYLPYYQKLISDDNREGKFNTLRESLDLVVAHVKNDEIVEYLRKYKDSKSIFENWSILSMVCLAMHREQLINEVEQTKDRRRLQNHSLMCQQLLQLMKQMSQTQKKSQISDQVIQRCTDLVYFISTGHQDLTGNALLDLQKAAQVQGLDSMKKCMNKNRQYLEKYRSFCEQLKSFVSQCLKIFNSFQKEKCSKLFNNWFPKILQNRLHSDTQKFYKKYEQIIEGRFFKKWPVSLLNQSIEQFKSKINYFIHFHGYNCKLLEQKVLQAMKQFLFQILYKCNVDNRRFYLAIDSLEKYILKKAKILSEGIDGVSFRFPLFTYYKDLFRLYLRVGLRHKAEKVLKLLRKVYDKEVAEEVYHSQRNQFLKQDDDTIMANSEKYYQGEELKHPIEGNFLSEKLNVSQDSKFLQDLNKQMQQFRAFPTQIDKQLNLQLLQLEILDILLVSEKGIRLGQAMMVRYLKNNNTEILVKFLLNITGQLEKFDWGGTKMLDKFHRCYIQVLFEVLLGHKDHKSTEDQSRIESLSQKQCESHGNHSQDQIHTQVTAQMMLQQIQVNLIKVNKTYLNSNRLSQKSTQQQQQQPSEHQQDSNSIRGAFLLAWCTGITLTTSVINRQQQNSYSHHYSSTTFISRVINLIKTCLVLIYASHMSNQIKLQTKNCPHKTSSTNDLSPKMIDSECAICLQALINEYQEEDTILRPNKMSVYELFVIYMELMYGREYYLRLKGVWHAFKEALAYERFLQASKQQKQQGQNISSLKLILKKLQRKMDKIQLLQLRNPYKGRHSNKSSCNKKSNNVEQNIRYKFMKSVQMCADYRKNTRQEICSCLKSKLGRLRCNISGG